MTSDGKPDVIDDSDTLSSQDLDMKLLADKSNEKLFISQSNVLDNSKRPLKTKSKILADDSGEKGGKFNKDYFGCQDDLKTKHFSASNLEKSDNTETIYTKNSIKPDRNKFSHTFEESEVNGLTNQRLVPKDSKIGKLEEIYANEAAFDDSWGKSPFSDKNTNLKTRSAICDSSNAGLVLNFDSCEKSPNNDQKQANYPFLDVQTKDNHDHFDFESHQTMKNSQSNHQNSIESFTRDESKEDSRDERRNVLDNSDNSNNIRSCCVTQKINQKRNVSSLDGEQLINTLRTNKKENFCSERDLDDYDSLNASNYIINGNEGTHDNSNSVKNLQSQNGCLDKNLQNTSKSQITSKKNCNEVHKISETISEAFPTFENGKSDVSKKSKTENFDFLQDNISSHTDALNDHDFSVRNHKGPCLNQDDSPITCSSRISNMIGGYEAVFESVGDDITNLRNAQINIDNELDITKNDVAYSQESVMTRNEQNGRKQDFNHFSIQREKNFDELSYEHIRKKVGDSEISTNAQKFYQKHDHFGEDTEINWQSAQKNKETHHGPPRDSVLFRQKFEESYIKGNSDHQRDRNFQDSAELHINDATNGGASRNEHKNLRMNDYSQHEKINPNALYTLKNSEFEERNRGLKLKNESNDFRKPHYDSSYANNNRENLHYRMKEASFEFSKSKNDKFRGVPRDARVRSIVEEKNHENANPKSHYSKERASEYNYYSKFMPDCYERDNVSMLSNDGRQGSQLKQKFLHEEAHNFDLDTRYIESTRKDSVEGVEDFCSKQNAIPRSRQQDFSSRYDMHQENYQQTHRKTDNEAFGRGVESFDTMDQDIYHYDSNLDKLNTKSCAINRNKSERPAEDASKMLKTNKTADQTAKKSSDLQVNGGHFTSYQLDRVGFDRNKSDINYSDARNDYPDRGSASKISREYPQNFGGYPHQLIETRNYPSKENFYASYHPPYANYGYYDQNAGEYPRDCDFDAKAYFGRGYDPHSYHRPPIVPLQNNYPLDPSNLTSPQRKTYNAYLKELENKRKPKVRICSNCGTTSTPSWRRCGDLRQLLCNACGLYKKLHGRDRPLNKVSDNMKRAKNIQPKLFCNKCGQTYSKQWRCNSDGFCVCDQCYDIIASEYVRNNSQKHQSHDAQDGSVWE